MSSKVSHHKFFFNSDCPGSYNLESKMYSLHVFGMDVKCFVAMSQRPGRFPDDRDAQFSYQVGWDEESKARNLLYKCTVRVSDNWRVLFTDTMASPEGSHGGFSSGKPPSIRHFMSDVHGMIRAEFNFEFRLQDDVRDPASAAELALPLLKDNILSDVVVVCGKESFDCHKFMLAARSEVFKTMLTSSFKEANTDRIELRDCDSKVVKAFIDFIYSDEVAENAVSWKLFHLAKMYELPRLQGLCLRGLRKKLNVDNCREMLEVTEKHDLTDLFNLAMDFFKKNEAAVAKTEGSH